MATTAIAYILTMLTKLRKISFVQSSQEAVFYMISPFYPNPSILKQVPPVPITQRRKW